MQTPEEFEQRKQEVAKRMSDINDLWKYNDKMKKYLAVVNIVGHILAFWFIALLLLFLTIIVIWYGRRLGVL